MSSLPRVSGGRLIVRCRPRKKQAFEEQRNEEVESSIEDLGSSGNSML
jgi:hypothetical protein